MARNSVNEWSTNPDDNLDIGGTNIAENCPPSGINNAIRKLMAQIKTSYTFVSYAAQALSAEQKTQARANIGAPSASEVAGDIDNLETAVQGMLNDSWALQPIGVPIAVSDNIAGVAAPPTDKTYRYIKLTASDAYNSGVLTGESVAGSAPNITATAIVSLAGSPLNGQTVPLINTDRRFLRGGSSGTKEQSQNLAHAHTGSTDTQGWHGHTGVTYAAGAHAHNVAIGPNGGVNYGQSYRIDAGFYGGATSSVTVTDSQGNHQHSLAIDGNGSHAHTVTIANNGGNEARPSNVGVTYYMRIK